jgi:hypothetical protein
MKGSEMKKRLLTRRWWVDDWQGLEFWRISWIKGKINEIEYSERWQGGTGHLRQYMEHSNHTISIFYMNISKSYNFQLQFFLHNILPFLTLDKIISIGIFCYHWLI